MTLETELWHDPRVALVELPSTSPGKLGEREASRGLDRLAEILGWEDGKFGPFGGVIPSGARVVVKPNWVMHENQGPWGIKPLLTDACIIRAVVEGVLRAEPSAVLLGDAPIQGCDFDRLLTATSLGAWAERLTTSEPRFKGIRDFRRTKCVFRNGIRVAFEDQLPLDQFILFDLGSESLLEPITDNRGSFRVTQYDPQEMCKTHGPGRHQYLVAREVIEADVIINLPKLKTHKKAGVTCALKNLIGINGNKEYLPHHRIGGSESAGDCYPGRSLIKRALEYGWDQMNLNRSGSGARIMLREVIRILNRVLRLMGDELGVEGSWSGNDTVWRTGLDLNRVLLYGRPNGTLADEPQRRVLHVVDAVVAGQGDGPLAPQPLGLGLMFAGGSAAAVDWVAAQLLGYDPERIPIARQAFGTFRWPIVSFKPSDVVLLGDLGFGRANELLTLRAMSHGVNYPVDRKSVV